MQKKLLCAAIVALSIPSAALAQSTVTLYGRVNLDMEWDKASGQPGVFRIVNDSSRLGIRGEENLGGGMKAIFQLENSINWDSGGGTLAGRESYVGLTSNWGTVLLGRRLDPMYSATWDSMPETNHDTGTASDALFGQAQNTQTAAAYGGVFVPNSVSYRTPNISGFTGEVTYSALSESTNPTRTSFIEGVISYSNGPWYFGTGYGDSKTANPLTTNRAEHNRAWPTVVVYDAKWLIIAGGYERAWRELPGFSTVARNYWRIAGEVPYGPHEFHVSYGNAGDSGVNDSGAQQWIIGYNYNLSKRTKVYAIYSRVDNERNGAYGFLTSSPGVDNSAYGVGMRVNF